MPPHRARLRCGDRLIVDGLGLLDEGPRIAVQARAVAGHQPRIIKRAVLRGAFLRGEIDVDDAEALGKAERPFEIVEQRPDQIAPDVGARVDRGVDGAEVPLEIVDAERVVDAPAVAAGGSKKAAPFSVM